jgi:hypothetical protein
VNLVRRHARGIVLALVAIVFAWFIWPTPYRTIGPRGLTQINRFTGVRCDVGESCWRGPREPSDSPRVVEPLPPELKALYCRDWVDTGENRIRDLQCRGGSSR